MEGIESRLQLPLEQYLIVDGLPQDVEVPGQSVSHDPVVVQPPRDLD